MIRKEGKKEVRNEERNEEINLMTSNTTKIPITICPV